MNKHLPMEETDLFASVIEVADAVWNLVQGWNAFAKSTTGRQLVRAIDSVGANLVEGDGRYSDAEAIHFFEFARGSAREAKYWISAAVRRRLMAQEQAQELIRKLDQSLQMLNGIINYRRRTKNANAVREETPTYGADRAPERQTPNAERLPILSRMTTKQ